MIPWNSAPTDLWAHSSCFQWLFRTNGSLASDLGLPQNLSKNQDQAGLCLSHTSGFLASAPALGETCVGSQFGLSWAPPSQAQVEAIFRLLCTSCQVAQAGQWLTLYLPGGPRASVPRGQLQTMPDYQPTTSTSYTLKGWTQRTLKTHQSISFSVRSASAQHLLLCSHSWLSHLIGLGVNASQWQQSRLNYNRTVHTDHTEGTPGVPSLCDWEGFTTGTYRTPTT